MHGCEPLLKLTAVRCYTISVHVISLMLLPVCIAVYVLAGVNKNDLQTDNNNETTLNGDVNASSVQRTSDLASMRKALATSKNSRVSVQSFVLLSHI
jgi:hypothetical protein